MIPVLLAGRDKAFFADFTGVLEAHHMRIQEAESGNKALSMISEQNFGLVIADEKLSDMSGLEFVRKLVAVNPMINCAVISSLSPEDFHEAGEGLGILMQLPPDPDKIHAGKLLEHLNMILNMTKEHTE
jgi:CheY-like chemotaxis protein